MDAISLFENAAWPTSDNKYKSYNFIIRLIEKAFNFFQEPLKVSEEVSKRQYEEVLKSSILEKNPRKEALGYVFGKQVSVKLDTRRKKHIFVA